MSRKSATRAIIISPLAGDWNRNMAYMERALRWAIDHGYSPIPFHHFLPSVLNDANPAERRLGIRLAHAWYPYAQTALVFTDLGISKGMRQDINKAISCGLTIHSISLEP